jgi:hypothetical protein
MINADEYDVHTRWRRLLVWTKRAGATSAVKRKSRRRERHDARNDVRRHGNRDDD